LGGSRGRLISLPERQDAVSLIQEACNHGARKSKACELLGVSLRTIERWERSRVVDRRKGANKKVGNKLKAEEREAILSIVNSPEHRDLPPCQIVPRLADKEIYLASESTIYRILREERQLKHRGLTSAVKHKRPIAHVATGPNQVWSWDITYLPSRVRGLYFYL
jgi:putative transposase